MPISVLFLKMAPSNQVTKQNFGDTARNGLMPSMCLLVLFFVDLLSPYAVFSKVMQSDDLDVLSAFTSLLRNSQGSQQTVLKVAQPMTNVLGNSAEDEGRRRREGVPVSRVA